jgi:hypothetical protein
MAPQNPKQGKNPANRDSQLFRSLTRLFSGPIISYRSESGRKIRRQHLETQSVINADQNATLILIKWNICQS